MSTTSHYIPWKVFEQLGRFATLRFPSFDQPGSGHVCQETKSSDTSGGVDDKTKVQNWGWHGLICCRMAAMACPNQIPCWKTVAFYARTTCLSLFGFCDCGSIRRKVDSFWNARFLKLWIRYQLALRNSPKITFGKIVCVFTIFQRQNILSRISSKRSTTSLSQSC